MTELIYFLDNFLDQEFEGHHRTERVQNSEMSYVWCLSIGDLNHDEYDSINPVHLNASA